MLSENLSPIFRDATYTQAYTMKAWAHQVLLVSANLALYCISLTHAACYNIATQSHCN